MVLEFLPCLLLIFFFVFACFLHLRLLFFLLALCSITFIVPFQFSILFLYFSFLLYYSYIRNMYSFKYSDYSGTNHHCCSIVALSRRLHLLIASVCIKIQCNCFPALNFSSLLFLSSCFKIF